MTCTQIGCENEELELHTCPYNADINNDDSLVCNCCTECTNDCAMDI